MYLNMVELYILAERLIIPGLQDCTMSSLAEMSKESFSTAWMTIAYEGTGAANALRKFAVDMCLDQVPPEWVLEHRNHFPHDLLIEVLVRMRLEAKSERETTESAFTSSWAPPRKMYGRGGRGPVLR